MHMSVGKILHTVLDCDIGLVIENKVEVFKSAYYRESDGYGCLYDTY